MAAMSTKAASKTIMVVDDESDLLATTSMILEKRGYKVHSFDNPKLALRHIQGVDAGCKDCALLVSDIKMPEMSGFELVRRLKELRPEMNIIFTSSFVIRKEEFQKVLPSAKVDELVLKPFTRDELVDAIKKCSQAE